MKIYDRYAGSAKAARREQRKFCTRRWIAMAVCVPVWLLLAGAARFVVSGTGTMFFLFWGLVVLCFILFSECILPLRQNDLYTFGFDGRDFAVMGVNGKSKRIVKPEELEMMHIVPANKPVTRIRYRRRGGGRHAIFTRYGEKKLVNGRKRFVHEPMALLLTKEQPQDRGLSWTDHVYPNPETLLYNNIGFIIGGENTRIFLKLLQNSTCPVMMSREFYELYKEMLNELFARAGMNPERLQMDEE